MNGLAKLRLFIELKENINKGLDAAHKKISKAMGSMQTKLNNFKAKNIEVFDTVTSRVPGVGKALGFLANPYTLIASAAMAAAVAIGAATTKAMEFEHTFMNIRQLNHFNSTIVQFDRVRFNVHCAPPKHKIRAKATNCRRNSEIDNRLAGHNCKSSSNRCP